MNWIAADFPGVLSFALYSEDELIGTLKNRATSSDHDALPAWADSQNLRAAESPASDATVTENT